MVLADLYSVIEIIFIQVIIVRNFIVDVGNYGVNGAVADQFHVLLNSCNACLLFKCTLLYTLDGTYREGKQPINK